MTVGTVGGGIMGIADQLRFREANTGFYNNGGICSMSSISRLDLGQQAPNLPGSQELRVFPPARAVGIPDHAE